MEHTQEEQINKTCLHCHHTGWIHTDDDVPDQMCPYCFVGKAVIKCYEKTTKMQLGRHEELLAKERSHDALLAGYNMNVIEAEAALEARKLYKHGTDISPIINGFIECLQGIIKRSEQAIAEAKPTKPEGE